MNSIKPVESLSAWDKAAQDLREGKTKVKPFMQAWKEEKAKLKEQRRLEETQKAEEARKAALAEKTVTKTVTETINADGSKTITEVIESSATKKKPCYIGLGWIILFLLIFPPAALIMILINVAAWATKD